MGMSVLSKAFIFLTVCLLTACAQPGTRLAVAQTVAAEASAPAKGMTRQQMYQFLLGEIASQRGDMRLASESFMDLARKTGDARLARRAAEWARHQPERSRSIKALRLWLELEPTAVAARERLIGVLLISKDVPALQAEMRLWLKLGPADQVWSRLAEQMTRLPALAPVALQAIEPLVREYATQPEAVLAGGRVALFADKPETAIRSAEAALALRKDWDRALLLKGDALARSDLDVAIAWWRDALERQPHSELLRTALAEALRRSGQVALAREEYRRLLAGVRAGSPAKAEWLQVLGMLSDMLNEPAVAERYLQEALAAGVRDADGTRIALGELAEKQGHLEKALDHYRSVGSRHQFEARIRAVSVLTRLQRFAEARVALQALRPGSQEDLLRHIEAEVELARAMGDKAAVFGALDACLAQLPDDPGLIYDHAMAAEQLGRFETTERDLRRLIELRPNDAHAYNALAYTLADRLNRAAEAVPLLETALKLSPEDPYILDSMGWALFKVGRMDAAVDYLQRAYKAMPDAEVALHLGEALWRRGDREAARTIWRAGLDHKAAHGEQAIEASVSERLNERLKW